MNVLIDEKQSYVESAGDSRRDAFCKLFGGALGALALGSACGARGEESPFTVEETVGALTSSSFRSVDTLAELPALPVPSGDSYSVLVLGYYDRGDGGGGLFVWDPAATETSSMLDVGWGALVISPNSISSPTPGRWRRVHDGVLNVKWFGARGGTMLWASDDTSAIQRAIDATNCKVMGDPTKRGRTIYFPRGTYQIGNSSQTGGGLVLPRLGATGGCIRFIGDGVNNTVLRGLYKGQATTDALIRFGTAAGTASNYVFEEMRFSRDEPGPVFAFDGNYFLAGTATHDPSNRLRHCVIRNVDFSGPWVNGAGAASYSSTVSLTSVHELIMENVRIDGNDTALTMDSFSRINITRLAAPYYNNSCRNAIRLKNANSDGGSGDISFVSPWVSALHGGGCAFNFEGVDVFTTPRKAEMCNIRITDPSFEGGDVMRFFQFRNARGVAIEGGSLGVPLTTGTQRRGFDIGGSCSDIVVNNMRFPSGYQPGNAAISVDAGARNVRFANIRVANQYFSLNSNVVFGTNGDGLNVDARFEGRTQSVSAVTQGIRLIKAASVIPVVNSAAFDADASDTIKFNGGVSSTSQIANGYDTQILTLIFETSGATLNPSASLKMLNGASYSPAAGTVMTFRRIGTFWYELSRCKT